MIRHLDSMHGSWECLGAVFILAPDSDPGPAGRARQDEDVFLADGSFNKDGYSSLFARGACLMEKGRIENLPSGFLLAPFAQYERFHCVESKAGFLKKPWMELFCYFLQAGDSCQPKTRNPPRAPSPTSPPPQSIEGFMAINAAVASSNKRQTTKKSPRRLRPIFVRVPSAHRVKKEYVNIGDPRVATTTATSTIQKTKDPNTGQE